MHCAVPSRLATEEGGPINHKTLPCPTSRIAFCWVQRCADVCRGAQDTTLSALEGRPVANTTNVRQTSLRASNGMGDTNTSFVVKMPSPHTARHHRTRAQLTKRTQSSYAPHQHVTASSVMHAFGSLMKHRPLYRVPGMSQVDNGHQWSFGTIPHTLRKPGSPVAHSSGSDAPAYGEYSSADRRKAALLLQEILMQSIFWLKGCDLSSTRAARRLYI